jgi:integrase
MASISKRPNGRWRARWREYPGGPEKARDFVRKVDAERFPVDVRAELQRGTYVDPTAGRVTFRDFAEDWRANRPMRSSSEVQLESYLRNHVYPVLGDRPLATIRRSHVQALVKGLSTKGLAPATVQLIYRHVAGAFRAAVKDRLIAVSPCDDVALPKVSPAKVKPLEVTTVQRLAEVVPDHVRALVLFAAGTGLRQGECFGLTVDRVDFLRRQVTVDRQTDPKGGEGFVDPKTDASWRTVPLAEATLLELAQHLERHGAGDDGRVFRQASGRHWRRNRFAEVWDRARRPAELPEWATFHDLRHFYASLLIHHGENVKVVQARLGHATAGETLDTYGHLWPDSDDATRAAVDAALGAGADIPRTPTSAGPPFPQVSALRGDPRP